MVQRDPIPLNQNEFDTPPGKLKCCENRETTKIS